MLAALLTRLRRFLWASNAGLTAEERAMLAQMEESERLLLAALRPALVAAAAAIVRRAPYASHAYPEPEMKSTIF